MQEKGEGDKAQVEYEYEYFRVISGIEQALNN